MDNSCWTGIVALFGIFGSVATAAAAVTAIKQLPMFVKGQETANMLLLTQIEAELRRVQEVVQTFYAKNTANSPIEEAHLELEYKMHIESWLNLLDRICSLCSKGLVDEKFFRADYFQTVSLAVTRWPEKIGNDLGQHRYIAEMHKKWNVYSG